MHERKRIRYYPRPHTLSQGQTGHEQQGAVTAKGHHRRMTYGSRTTHLQTHVLEDTTWPSMGTAERRLYEKIRPPTYDHAPFFTFIQMRRRRN